MNTFEPQRGAEDLAPHHHRLELVGDPDAFAWPELCPNCGASAHQTIRVEKVFWRNSGIASDRVAYHVIAGATVPYCDNCVEQHLREEPGMTPLERFVSTLKSQMALPALFSGLTGLFCLKEALADLSDSTGVTVMGGVGAFFLLISYLSYRSSVSGTKRLRVPAQTSVTRAFDFSDDLSDLFDGARRLYAIKNEAFATAFAAMNSNQAWDPDAPAAQKTETKRNVLVYVVAVVAIAVAIWNWLHP